MNVVAGESDHFVTALVRIVTSETAMEGLRNILITLVQIIALE